MRSLSIVCLFLRPVQLNNVHMLQALRVQERAEMQRMQAWH